MSSATILFVMKNDATRRHGGVNLTGTSTEPRRQLEFSIEHPKGPSQCPFTLAMAFGPGLSIELVLLRKLK